MYTTFRKEQTGCGADGSALRLGRRGRRFKSGHPDFFCRLLYKNVP